jgi:hypothetical protein
MSGSTVREEVCREFYFRRTGMGGLSLTVIVLNGKVLAPRSVQRSRSGSHGSDIYCLTAEEWRHAWIINLEQSNSGRRDVSFSDNVPEHARKAIEQLWYRGVSVRKIEQVAQELYSCTKL